MHLGLENRVKLLQNDQSCKGYRDGILFLLNRIDYKDYEKNFIVVYGSLRRNEYNYLRLRNIFGTSELIYIANCSVEGYQLIDAGEYPIAVYTGDESVIEGELMYVGDKAAKAIQDMEFSAGYEVYTDFATVEPLHTSQPIKISVDFYVASLSLTKKSKDMPVVKTGNWSEYLLSTYARD